MNTLRRPIAGPRRPTFHAAGQVVLGTYTAADVSDCQTLFSKYLLNNPSAVDATNNPTPAGWAAFLATNTTCSALAANASPPAVGQFALPAGSTSPGPAVDCATAFSTWLTANPLPVEGISADMSQPQPPDTSSWTAFAAANPSCATWAQGQITAAMAAYHPVALRPVFVQGNTAVNPILVAQPAAPADNTGWYVLAGVVAGALGAVVVTGAMKPSRRSGGRSSRRSARR